MTNSFRFGDFRIRILAEEVLKKCEFEAPLLARVRLQIAQFQQEDEKSNSCVEPKHGKMILDDSVAAPAAPSPMLLYIRFVLTGLLYESCIH